mmetsp:Transcript_18519/g.30318  ORF Transcript_18519/g.30318 Transcript_18519/m.30318 type:complete len:251 (-) Transcript_18519:117-869(-)
MMLKMVVDPIGRHKGARYGSGNGGAHVAEGVLGHFCRAVFGDIAHPQDELEPCQIGHDPEGDTPPPVSDQADGQRYAEKDREGGEYRVGFECLCRIPFGRLNGIAVACEFDEGGDLAEQLFDPGLAGEVADEFASEGCAGGREVLAEHQIGVFVGLRMAVVRQVVVSVGLEVGHDRPAAEPGAHPCVDFGGFEERVMGGIVHQNRETQLPRADEQNGEDCRKRVWPESEERNSSGDHTPAMQDQQRACDV